MADPAQLNQGVAALVLRSWRHPRDVVRALYPMSEGALLAVLMGAMLLALLAQLPGHARAAYFHPEVPLVGRVAGSLQAVLFLILFYYLLAWVVALLSRLTPWVVEGEASRLALFWALLAAGPAILLAGLVEGMLGAGPAALICGVAAALAFVVMWAAGLRELARRK